jgi:hypothetical protein
MTRWWQFALKSAPATFVCSIPSSGPGSEFRNTSQGTFLSFFSSVLFLFFVFCFLVTDCSRFLEQSTCAHLRSGCIYIWCLFFFFPFVVDHRGSWFTRVWHIPLGFEPTMCVELRVADSTSLLCNRHSESVNTCVIHAARWIMTHDWKSCICNLSSRRILHASCYFSPFVVVHWGSWIIRVWPTTWVELGVADSTSFLCIQVQWISVSSMMLNGLLLMIQRPASAVYNEGTRRGKTYWT